MGNDMTQKIIVREYKETDFEEVVRMYYQMCVEVYPHRQFKPIRHFFENVMFWINNNYDIVISEDNGTITGFSMCYVDNMGGIVKDYYQGECIFIKDEYRKGRSAYLLYHTNINIAESMGYILSTNASDVTESSGISKKLGIKLFTKYERMNNGNVKK